MKHLIIFLKGLLMGVADIIPGVSGGTMAFITGIYERLIKGLKDIGDFLRGKLKLKDLDFALFIPLVLGIGTAFLVMSRFIGWLLKDYPAPTFSLFIGLILASAWFIWKNIDEFSPVAIFTCIIGGMMGILISLVPISAEGGQTLVSVFFLGVVSICAMLLPGISGSYILLMFGHYEYIIGALHDLNLQILGVFAVGATIGLLLFSRLISWMLRQVKNETFAFLMGLMLGALTRPGQEVLAELHTTTVFAFSLFFLLLGIILVLWLERFSEKGNNELWV